MESEQIYQTIVKIISNSLALEPGEVARASRLVDDLGMDSLDFLDIMFVLEKEYNVKIRDAQVDGFLRPNANSEIPATSHFSEEEINKLSSIMPAIKDTADTHIVMRNQVFSLITVDTIVRIVQEKLQQAK